MTEHNAVIVAEHYFTAAEGVYGREHLNHECVSSPGAGGTLDRLMLYVLELSDGRLIVGRDVDSGRRTDGDYFESRDRARDDAMRQV